MDIEMLRHELEILKLHSENIYTEIHSVCQRVIDAADVMPRHIEHYIDENCPEDSCYVDRCSCGAEKTNEMLSKCTAIVAKNFIRRDSLPTKEDCRNFLIGIADNIIEQYEWRDDGDYRPSQKELALISDCVSIIIEDAAQSIAERINK